jgi:hypothetical protein
VKELHHFPKLSLISFRDLEFLVIPAIFIGGNPNDAILCFSDPKWLRNNDSAHVITLRISHKGGGDIVSCN